MSAQETLGKIINNPSEGRDAIHIALAPVTSAGLLAPGAWVRLVKDDPTKVESCDQRDSIGIVDPFLPRAVRTGQRCWLFLNPNTITSLRHVWTHPAFPQEWAPPAPKSRDTSEAWLRDFCQNNDVPSYETTIAIAAKGPECGNDYLLVRDMDAHANLPDEFWDHVEVVIGRKVPRRVGYFSCAC